MKSLPAGKQCWCTKHASEQCGVGITLKFWNLQLDDLCQRCSSPENTTHVLQCITPDTTKVWNDHMTKLTTFLYQSLTPEDLITATLSHLHGWRLQAPLPLDPSWSPTLLQVITEQDAIGWKNLLEGLASTTWTQIISASYSSRGICKSSASWMTHFLTHLHTLAWSLWDHRNAVLPT